MKAILSGFLLLIVSSAYAAPLDPYLLRPEDRPAECQPTQGLFPVNPKVATFYEYQTYKVTLPPALERHAQSLECGSQKGTLYFFAYQDADQADMAQQFARSVLTGPTPSLVIESFPKGFVILSYAEPPASLRDALNRKLHLTEGSNTAAVSRSTAAVAVAAPVQIPVSTPTAVPSFAAAAAPVVPAAPISPPPSLPPPAIPPAVTPVRPAIEPDLSDDFLKKLQKTLECKKEIDADLTEACNLIQTFKKGKRVDDLLVAAPSARVGEAIRITETGQIRGRFYNVAVGSGRNGEIAIYPLMTETGVQEIEAKALVDCRKEGKVFPPGNELTDRVAKMNRPDHSTAYPTHGRSQMLRLGGNRRIYIRNSGDRWILISVNPNPQDLLDPTDIVLSELY